tara:strand:+ start:1702 stop:2607 length:906 start_codon:yes stop_codon:yes gene_type:complete
MEGVDLNLDNYSLDDLLSLFSLSPQFTSQDLRQARRVVAQVHPDKSQLPSNYFAFFDRAYRLLEQVHRTQMSRADAAARESRGPRPEEVEYETERDEALATTLGKYTKSPGFNKVFNDLFEKHASTQYEQSEGHGDWLVAEDDKPDLRGSREEAFARCKRDARQLAVIPSVAAANEGGGTWHSDLVADHEGSYGSSTSSTLPYQDLRQAHEVSVIPVSEELDFDQRKQYAGVGALKAEREFMDRTVVCPSMEDSRHALSQQESDERTAGMRRAFTLAKQQEEGERASAGMLSGMMRLTQGR